MKQKKLFLLCIISLGVAPGSMLAAQVQTNVPDVVPGAKPVTVEHIKIHGTSLEGNIPSSTRCTASSLALSSGRTKFMSRRRLKAHLQRARPR
jgi:hypothetical protein